MDNDIELLSRFKNGDAAAFELLVRKYKDKVFSTCYSIVGNRDVADDACQEVFLKIYKKAGGFNERSSFGTWVYRIAVTTALNELRKRRKEIISLDAPLTDDEKMTLESVLEGGTAADENLRRESARDFVQTLLNTLDEKYRTVLTLKEIEGMSYKEISAVMKISIDKVKVWLFRARQALRGKIKK